MIASEKKSHAFHFGVLCLPFSGHMFPFFALAETLERRGHRVTFFTVADGAALAGSCGFRHVALGTRRLGPNSVQILARRMSRMPGLFTAPLWLAMLAKMSAIFCEEAPAALRAEGIEVLLADQVEPAAEAIASCLNLPFITLCMALAMHRQQGLPPPWTGKGPPQNRREAFFNDLLTAAGDRLAGLSLHAIRRHRRRWRLPPVHPSTGFFALSSLAQICQQPPGFDFPGRRWPSCLHFVGPLRSPSFPEIPSFPFSRLTGQPVIFASLGILKNRRIWLFKVIAEACQGLDAQLVMAHGGGLDEEEARNLPGTPLVVPFAPQRILLGRAVLTITHGGLNTVLDSLAHGVPMVAIPMAFEQPGIAARLAFHGAGRILAPNKVTGDSLRQAILDVAGKSRYRQAAQRFAAEIALGGGRERAAEIIEEAAWTQRPVPCRFGYSPGDSAPREG
jgi:MGT family glycosyltransferase